MIKSINKTEYKLKSVLSGKIFEDTGWLLEAPGEEKPGLIRTVYKKEKLEVKDESFGIYKFADWLPVNKMLIGSYAPLTYKSEGLAKELGLSNLYITFNGYWPEKGIEMKTCSFKETEAYTVCGRLNSHTDKVLVVASAGNTARAFAQVCSDNNIPLLLCVPEDYVNNEMWLDKPINDCVKLIVSKTGSDYYDAIHISNLVCKLDRFFPEGGAKNVARREGMGTTVLSAATHIGEIPEYYFQAVGSGTGAVAAWEANLRLLKDGNFGNRKMKLMVSQNHPFKPLQDAWRADSRDLSFDDEIAKKLVDEIDAKVLSNRRPPYSITGGLYDALKDNGGDVLTATNEEARTASALFEKTEGIDIHPAAAVATATLIKEVKENRIKKNALIMLNITGGGEARFKNITKLHYIKPSVVFDVNPDFEEIKRKMEGLF